MEEFESLGAARRLTTAWKEDYNHHRPHSSLGYVPPAVFAATCCEEDDIAARCAGSVRPTASLRPHSRTYSIRPS